MINCIDFDMLPQESIWPWKKMTVYIVHRPHWHALNLNWTRWYPSYLLRTSWRTRSVRPSNSPRAIHPDHRTHSFHFIQSFSLHLWQKISNLGRLSVSDTMSHSVGFTPSKKFSVLAAEKKKILTYVLNYNIFTTVLGLLTWNSIRLTGPLYSRIKMRLQWWKWIKIKWRHYTRYRDDFANWNCTWKKLVFNVKLKVIHLIKKTIFFSY